MLHWLLFLTFCSLFCCFGCKKQGIQHYTTPKTQVKEVSELSAMAQVELPSLQMPTWVVPEAWRPKMANNMQIAVFEVLYKGLKGEVTVAAFPGEVGGMLANVNRWAQQLGLKAFKEEMLPEIVQPIILGSHAAEWITLKNGDQALSVVALKNRGYSWFFKCMGAASVVDAEAQNFKDFVSSVNF